MGLWKRRAAPSISVTDGISYEDAAGMITTGGVIAALCVSFAIALDKRISPTELQENDFRIYLSGSQDFRDFAVGVMDSEDVGVHGAENFNWSLPLGTGPPLDMRQMLLEGMKETEGCREEPGQQLHLCVDGEVETLMDVLSQAFPMTKMRAWVRSHPDALDHVPFYLRDLLSSSISLLSALAMVSQSLALYLSMISYISLVASPAQEDESGAAFKQWLKGGVPLMLLMYAFLLAGIVLYFLTHRRFLIAKSAMFQDTLQVSDALFLGIFMPVAVGLFCIALVNSVASFRAARRNRLAKEARDQLTSDQVATIVEGMGFRAEAGLFKLHEIDGSLLQRMSVEMLQQIGVQKLGVRMKLEVALKSFATGADIPEQQPESAIVAVDKAIACPAVTDLDALEQGVKAGAVAVSVPADLDNQEQGAEDARSEADARLAPTDLDALEQGTSAEAGAGLALALLDTPEQNGKADAGAGLGLANLDALELCESSEGAAGHPISSLDAPEHCARSEALADSSPIACGNGHRGALAAGGSRSRDNVAAFLELEEHSDIPYSGFTSGVGKSCGPQCTAWPCRQ